MLAYRWPLNSAKNTLTIGFDLNKERIKQLQGGIDKTLEVDKKELNTANLTDIGDCNTSQMT